MDSSWKINRLEESMTNLTEALLKATDGGLYSESGQDDLLS
jgi:hypothetical protein